jgi:ectoine hydroxylase-related dioxygenase (phytanoyl-CoA dioxygenase family)
MIAGSEPPSFLLSRYHVWLTITHVSGSPEAGAVLRVVWPERQLQWCTSHCARLAPGELLSCTVRLLCLTTGDPAGVAELLRRVQSAGVTAEVTLVSPQPLPLRPATLFDLQVPQHDDSLATTLSLLHTHGCAIFPAQADLGVPSLVALAARRTALVTHALTAAELRPFVDDFMHVEAASRTSGRIEVRLPLSTSEAACYDRDAQAIRTLASAAPWASAVRAALRDSAPLVTASVVVSRPGAHSQLWHADAPHVEDSRPVNCQPSPPWEKWWTMLHQQTAANGEEQRVTGAVPPHAICVFLPLIDITPELGCTQMWLGSHAWPQLVEQAPGALGTASSPEGPLALRGAVLWPCVPAGTGVMYDYRLVHRGAANTGDVERPVLQLVYRTHKSADGGLGWDEEVNFGSTSLLGALEPHTAWLAKLDGTHGDSDAARGVNWWASQTVQEVADSASHAPRASAWALFD